MHLLRRSMLSVAERPSVERLVRNERVANRVVWRFVAGEDLETAIAAVRDLALKGITSTLDELGENVSSHQQAQSAADSCSVSLRRLADANLEPNISVKLTMLGLDLGDDVARENMVRILDVAREAKGFVRIDMEGSAYAERTMTIFEELHDRFPNEVGIVIQSYLRRARTDTERMIARKARVRLVKGAYAEPEAVAFQKKHEIDLNYILLMELLLDQGIYPALATHDPDLIEAAKEFTAGHGISSHRYEFQMLYGVRRDEQQALVDQGYRVRVYVPYGSAWYPYFSRRIAERPANAFFALRQIAFG
ncbi:MAG: proline dehydrogenase family protein [Thermomicrobiales bacterium]